MTKEDDRYCEKHPDEVLQYCSFCVREIRLELRQEYADLTAKMRAYRQAILGREDPLPEEPPRRIL